MLIDINFSDKCIHSGQRFSFLRASYDVFVGYQNEKATDLKNDVITLTRFNELNDLILTVIGDILEKAQEQEREALLDTTWSPDINSIQDNQIVYPSGLNLENEGSRFVHLQKLIKYLYDNGERLPLPEIITERGVVQKMADKGVKWKPEALQLLADFKESFDNE